MGKNPLRFDKPLLLCFISSQVYYVLLLLLHTITRVDRHSTQYTYTCACYNRRPSYAIGTMGRFLHWTMRLRFFPDAHRNIGRHYTRYIILQSVTSAINSRDRNLRRRPTRCSRMRRFIGIIIYIVVVVIINTRIIITRHKLVLHRRRADIIIPIQQVVKAITFYRKSAKIILVEKMENIIYHMPSFDKIYLFKDIARWFAMKESPRDVTCVLHRHVLIVCTLYRHNLLRAINFCNLF